MGTTETPEVAVAVAADRVKAGRVFHWITLTVAMIAVVLSGYLAWTVRSFSAKFADLKFSQDVSDYERDTDLVSPEVGTMQFLHRGYTISFSSVQYTPNGLELSGTLGNPNWITLSTINLKLSARPWPYKVKDKVLQSELYLLFGDSDIGTGQTSIPRLSPGTTAPFEMTIQT